MKGRQKRRPTEVDRLNNLWVGRQGFSLLRRLPLRRFRALRAALANAHAFTQLRALSGSNPCRGNKKAAGIRQSLFYSMVGRQGFGPAARATAAALSRLARCAGKRSRVSSAPRPFGFEPMKGRQKRRPTEVDRLNNLWVGRQGFEPWTLGLKVPCSAS